MMRPAIPAAKLVGGLWAAAVAGLACITLASPGATRMFAWPWTVAFAATLAAPAAILILRAGDPARPLVLPARSWTFVALATFAGVLLSALASPYRGTSLLWSAPLLGAIALFFAVFDWLHADAAARPRRRGAAFSFLALFFGAAAAVGLALWLNAAITGGWAQAIAARNLYPLGHSNYTAGLALLLLPCALAVKMRHRGFVGGLASAGAALAVATLFTSGSRGGIAGLAALVLAGLWLLPFPARRKTPVAVLLAAAVLAFVVVNPRTRAMLTPRDPAAAPNLSNVQRSAMLTAGWHMGLDRPLLGWGPGTTPLAFPRYRAGLEGGAENVLQLHCAPAQLWAELGGWGVAAALAFLALGGRSARREPFGAAALAGYGFFSLFDWQLDVPAFAFGVAALAALLAPPAAPAASSMLRRSVGAIVLLALALVALLGWRDPAPLLNVHALQLAGASDQNGPRAAALLRESLALNPQQEIALFNLGWLLVVSDPAAAEKNFHAAAHLVPDKGGVYFGLGLARLNRGQRDAAARAFALECLNDPAFLVSPWWREPAIAAVRDATEAALRAQVQRAQAALVPGSWAAAQLARVAACAPQLGRVPPGPERVSRRERTGYPVLMRNLDLPTPIDLYLVREPASVPSPELAALPAKGWLPSPLLLALLDESVSPTP